MFARACLAALLALTAAIPVRADIAEMGIYTAIIAPRDMQNSQGVDLTDPGAMIAQDRANFHRFGIRQSGDESDAHFGQRAQRARIPDLVRAGWVQPEVAAALRRRQTVMIQVVICGAGQPSYLVIYSGDLDGHSGCF